MRKKGTPDTRSLRQEWSGEGVGEGCCMQRRQGRTCMGHSLHAKGPTMPHPAVCWSSSSRKQQLQPRLQRLYSAAVPQQQRDGSSAYRDLATASSCCTSASSSPSSSSPLQERKGVTACSYLFREADQCSAASRRQQHQTGQLVACASHFSCHARKHTPSICIDAASGPAHPSAACSSASGRPSSRPTSSSTAASEMLAPSS